MDEILWKMKSINSLILVLILAFFIYLKHFSTSQEIFSNTTFYILFDICKNQTTIFKDYGTLENYIYFNLYSFGEYQIKLLDNMDKEILSFNFSVSFEREAEELDPITGNLRSKKIILDCIEIYLRFPYIHNLSKILVYKNSDIIGYLELCNKNNICESNLGENENNCQDCKKITKEKICLNIKDSICEENCPEDPDCKIPTFSIPFWIFPVSILVFSILLFIYFLKKSKISKVYPPKS